jgi:hypothetical protein
MQSIQHSEPVPPTEPTTTRLRTVTGSRWPRKCACGCGLNIPRDPEARYVVDFGAPKPYPAYLREHTHTTLSERLASYESGLSDLRPRNLSTRVRRRANKVLLGKGLGSGAELFHVHARIPLARAALRMASRAAIVVQP